MSGTHRPRSVRVIRAALLVALSPALCVGAETVPERISVFPAEVRLDGAGSRQQLAVTGHDSGGSLRDLTTSARFVILDQPAPAVVSPSGVVTPVADGSAHVRIEAVGQSVDVSVTVTNSQSARPPSYRLGVAPILAKAGCNMGACHGNLNGKGGFRLSLRGDDPAFDLAMMTRESFGRRVDRQDPDASLILRKPTGRVPHEGGLRFTADSLEARTLRGWIASGAADDIATAPKLTRLTVFPAERINAAPSLSQQLVVTAEFDDGSRRDVTRQASYDVNDPTRVEVTPDGRVVATAPGEVTVAVRYMDGRGISRLAFLHDRPDFAWQPVEPTNLVDEHVLAKLRSLKIRPSELCTDAEFIRRAYLDLLGILPTPAEVRTFLDDNDPAKRSKLVDALLQRPELADFWALKWADLLRNEEKTMGAKGVWVFQRWLRDQIAADVPLDEFVRRIVSGRGSTWQNPPSSFYRTNRDPETAAEAVGQVFLGVRLQCARCHNHPFDIWTQDDYYGLAATFANLGRKQPIPNQRRDKFDKHEINVDEIVFVSGKPQMVQPRSGEMMQPRPPGGPPLDLAPGDANALDNLAEWLTRGNPQFARNLANRIWYHLMGRGIVEPVDDFRDSNPPSNPALLEALTAEFIRNGMRLRPLAALIMKSKTYQLSSTPNATNAEDEANFARATVKLLPAEVLLDAVSQVLDTNEPFRGAPRSARAVQLAGTRMGSDFLKVFGKPDRLLTCECERSEATTLAQALLLINGEDVRDRLEKPGNRIDRMLQAGTPDEAILSDLYLAALGREPTVTESAGAIAHVQKSADRRKAWEDVAWALLNSKEFLLRH
jgi:hypothetical protein